MIRSFILFPFSLDSSYSIVHSSLIKEIYNLNSKLISGWTNSILFAKVSYRQFTHKEQELNYNFIGNNNKSPNSFRRIETEINRGLFSFWETFGMGFIIFESYFHFPFLNKNSFFFKNRNELFCSFFLVIVYSRLSKQLIQLKMQ